MKLKTSIIVISGCLGIFLFIMLPIFLSTQGKKDDYVASLKGSAFSLKDVNNNIVTEKSFEGLRRNSGTIPKYGISNIQIYQYP